LASKKYNALNPSMAKMFEVYRIKGSFGAMANMAGIESTAKIRSVNSITATTTSKGVAIFSPFSLVKIIFAHFKETVYQSRSGAFRKIFVLVVILIGKPRFNARKNQKEAEYGQNYINTYIVA
jgi:hypothetical protein